MELKGSKTEANLWIAFAGESQARNKLRHFCQQGQERGATSRSRPIFQENRSEMRRSTPKLWFKALDGIGSTEENLVAAAVRRERGMDQDVRRDGEDRRGGGLPGAGRPVRGRGQDREDPRGEVLKAAGTNLKKGEVFKKGEKVMWFCRNCGHVEIAESAPAVCPVCKHPQAYFQVKAENY
mgnify:CR=1 FL=1